MHVIVVRHAQAVHNQSGNTNARYRFVFLKYGGSQWSSCDFGDFLKKFRDIFGSKVSFVIIYGVAGVDRNGELREFFSDPLQSARALARRHRRRSDLSKITPHC